MHTYYLIGCKKANDEIIRDLFNRKRELEKDIKFFKSLSNFKEEVNSSKRLLKDVNNQIDKIIIENRFIKKVLFSEIGNWYINYKRVD